MNKEELLKRLDSQQPIVMVRDREVAIEELKPVVPQFVADWYEAHKDNFEYSVQCLCVQGCEPVRQIDTWFDDDSNKPIETLVMMHKFGYKVKKEKLYTVELPNPNSFSLIILRRNEEGKIYISFNIPNLEKWKSDENTHLTEAEIKEDFAWALQFKEEVKDNE